MIDPRHTSPVSGRRFVKRLAKLTASLDRPALQQLLTYDAARIANAARGDHRHADRVHNLRHERERSGLRANVLAQKHTAMATSLGVSNRSLAQPKRKLENGGQRQPL